MLSFKNKRGQGLSMNFVVVAMIAVIVLVVIAIIFAGGVGSSFRKMGEIFQLGTQYQSLAVVIEKCNIACTLAQTMENPKTSPYCKSTFTYETGNKAKKTVHCYEDVVGVSCPGIKENCKRDTEEKISKLEEAGELMVV